VRDGRLARLRVTLPDVAGSLARVTTMIGEAGGNIIEVQHQRVFDAASAKSAEVEFAVEARDREHMDSLLRTLQTKGVKAGLRE
jgi:threonine dehydratase